MVERYQAMTNWATAKFWDDHVYQDHKTGAQQGSIHVMKSVGISIAQVDTTNEHSFHRRFIRFTYSMRLARSLIKDILTSSSIASRKFGIQ